MNRFFRSLAIVLAAVFTAPAHAENSLFNRAYETLDSFAHALSTPLFTYKDTECLARNIYHEAANEPEEGMVAVGVVTINRANDPRYPKTLCGVVQQRTTLNQVIVCQFSWTCMKVRKPKEDDPRWQKAVYIAERLSYGEYEEWREKYGKSFHFHSVHINPGWKLKRVNRIGGHIFYH